MGRPPERNSEKGNGRLIAGLFQYSFAQAKTRALKAQLLSREDWQVLQRMESTENVLRYLGGTVYGSALAPHRASGRTGAVEVSLVLYDVLFADYAKLVRAAPEKASRVLRDLVLRFEGENLKTILRGIWKGTSPGEVRSFLFRLGALSRLPEEDLLHMRQVEPCIDLLKSTAFHAALHHALSQYKVQGRLFPLEMAIDISVFQLVSASIKHMAAFDRKKVDSLVGGWIDGIAVSWLVRLRHVYGLSPEEAIHYTPAGCRLIQLQDLGRLARAKDLQAFLAALPLAYRERLAPARHWEDIHGLLQGSWIEEFYRAFRGSPFHAGLPVAYLLLKELEVQAVASLLSILDFHGPSSGHKLSDWLHPPVRGGLHVQV